MVYQNWIFVFFIMYFVFDHKASNLHLNLRELFVVFFSKFKPQFLELKINHIIFDTCKNNLKKFINLIVG